ncbi:GNAT family N-acetyltransferase [Pantoea sp. 1.19]|uniref:GNAT family N-acetyltransferase n=1 Tax=Pantoea sp. 1.19 TaxID=1925589 RepID=UPI000948A504|nr:GNAT family N-acetyltransferase [Pantoea sp. 1.19]
MSIRLAHPDEAEACWRIRNQAIRSGCATHYSPAIITAWTPEAMPASFPAVLTAHPFFVADAGAGYPVATGFLDADAGRVEALFTLPAWAGRGYGSAILAAIQRGMPRLTLSATPNAVSFYRHHGFILLRESVHHSALAGADLRCFHMQRDL